MKIRRTKMDIYQLKFWPHVTLLPSSPGAFSSSSPRDFLSFSLLLPFSSAASSCARPPASSVAFTITKSSARHLLCCILFGSQAAAETEAEVDAAAWTEQLELDCGSVFGELQALRWLPSPL